MDKQLIQESYEIWNDFQKEVMYRNRFFVEHKVLDIIKEHVTICKKNLISGTKLYRARVMNDFIPYLHYLDSINEECDLREDFYKYMQIQTIRKMQKTGFWGYDEQNSSVPENNDPIGDGRANPCYIKYLYASESAYTALVEVRPFIEEKVSIAELQVNEDICMADFSYDTQIDFSSSLEASIFGWIIYNFSKPNKDNKRDYIPTQYISEYIKSLGFDGIRYNSSLHKTGINLAIFNHKKCKPINSKVYKITDICYETKCIAPTDGPELINCYKAF